MRRIYPYELVRICRNRQLVIWIIAGLFLHCHAQDEIPPEIDSLKHVVATQNDNLQKADNLIRIGKYYFHTNEDSCLHYYRKVYALSAKLNYQEGLADAYYNFGSIYRFKLNYDSAVYYNKIFTTLAESLDDSARMAKAYYNQGYIYQMENDTWSSTESFRKALVYFTATDHQVGILGSYNAIAKNYSRLSRFDSAAIYYHKALDYLEPTGNRANIGTVNSNIGEMYLELGQLEDSERYIRKAMEIYIELDLKAEIANSFNNLGRIEMVREDWEKALKYSLTADSLFLQIDYLVGHADMENNLGMIYDNMGKMSLALERYFDALRTYRELNLARGEQITLNNISLIYNKLGEYGKALAYADSSLKLTYVTGELEPRKKVLMNFSQIFEEMGDYKMSLKFNKQYEELEDSIYNIEKDKLINDLSLKYEKEKNEAEILILENENLEKDLELRKRTSQRNVYFFGGLALISLGIFVALYFRQRRVKDKIIADQKILQLEEEKKLMAAKFLVEGQEEERKRIARELHDGLGVLLSATKMQFTTLKDNSPENHEIIRKATELLEQATGDVRKISHNMMPGLLTKLGLYEALEDLFETINDKGELKARCAIDADPPRLPENKEIMLYRIVQELVNNTLKHAGASNIELEIQAESGFLKLNYADDGRGFDPAGLDNSRSLGISSMRSRVNFLNGKLDLQTSPGNGVRYFISVPV